MMEKNKKKAEQIFRAMEHVEEEFLRESGVIGKEKGSMDPYHSKVPADGSVGKTSTAAMAKKRNFWKRMLLPAAAMAAACLALVVWWGGSHSGQNDDGTERQPFQSGAYLEHESQGDGAQTDGAQTEDSTDRNAQQDILAGILRQRENGAATEAALRFTLVPLAGRIAEYHEVKGDIDLEFDDNSSMIALLEGTENMFYFPELERYEYLISVESDGSFVLWQFSHFQVWDAEEQQRVAEAVERGESLWNTVEWYHEGIDVSPYSYELVLELIYGVDSAEEIEKIAVEPANMDNTDAGKKLQQEIGTMEITDRAEIETIYQTLTELVCLGDENWQLIFPADSGTDENGGLLPRVQLSRYLTIFVDDFLFTEIDSLKYTAVSNRFYEYSGIAYEALSAEDAAAMEQILRIQP